MTGTHMIQPSRRVRRTLVGLLAVAGLVVPAATASAASSPAPPALTASVAAAPASVSLVLSDEAARSAALSFARGHGLSVLSSTAGVVQLSGPAGRLAALFGTTVHGERQNGRQRVVHDGRLSVPAALAGRVRAAVGLDDRPLFRPLAIPQPGLTPSDVQAAYHLPAAADRGAGVTVATVQFSDWNQDDASTYATAAGIALAPGQITTVPTGNLSDIVTDTIGNGATEVSLDVEALLATAPGSRQRVYVSGNTSSDALAAYGRILTDVRAGLVQVVSTSWGLCEANLDPADIQAQSSIMTQIVAAGATVFAATGDNGSDDCYAPDSNTFFQGVDYPASDPAVVGVGGTVLASDGSETSWEGSGGGASDVFGRPAFQAGLPGALATRTVPDVSAVAGTGFAVYAQGAWQAVGGTSLAAPTWAGGLASALPAAGCSRGAGDLHRFLYANQARLDDVADGGTNGAYVARAGYDPVTGLGTPRWDQLTAPLAQHCGGVGYRPLAPARILDTRSGLGAPAAPLGPNGMLTLQVTGRGGVPTTGVSAVVLNVTVTNVTAASVVRVFPAGTPLPNASNLNLVPGHPMANLVTVKTSPTGAVSIHNLSGSTDVVADVEGYYTTSVTGGLRYTPLSPSRLLDTRTGNGGYITPVGGGKAITLKVAGRGGVPASGATAVLLNLTATDTTAGTYVTAWPGGTRPTTSNLNLPAGATRANLVSVPLSSTGTISLYNMAGTTDLVVDVAGFYGAFGDVAYPVAPTRILDTRVGIGAPVAPLHGGVPLGLQVTGQAGVPSDGVDGVVANVTITDAMASGHLTVYPLASSVPLASNVNYAVGDTVPNLAAVRLGAGGRLGFLINSGHADVIADLAAYLVP